MPRQAKRRPLMKAVLLTLADDCEHDGTKAFTSVARIADECEIGTRTVDSLLVQLQQHGLISLQARHRQHRPATWRLELKALAASADPDRLAALVLRPETQAAAGLVDHFSTSDPQQAATLAHLDPQHVATLATDTNPSRPATVCDPKVPDPQNLNPDPQISNPDPQHVATEPREPSTTCTEKKEVQLALTPSEPTLSAESLQSLWNELISTPKCNELTPQRRRQAQARLRERGLDGMRVVIERLNANQFLRGDNDRGWRPNFDWVLKPANIAKVLEGAYDHTPRKPPTSPGRTGAPAEGKYAGLTKRSPAEVRP